MMFANPAILFVVAAALAAPALPQGPQAQAKAAEIRSAAEQAQAQAAEKQVKAAESQAKAAAQDAQAKAAERDAQVKAAAAKAVEQAKAIAAKAAEQEAQATARREAQAINVRIDVTITDQTSAEQPAVKTLTLLAADWSWTRVRSEGTVWTTGGQYPISLRVDTRPHLLQGDKIHLEMILEYKPTAPDPKPGASATTLSESCDIVLESGKPLVISQAADPNSDRKVKLEVKATILR